MRHALLGFIVVAIGAGVPALECVAQPSLQLEKQWSIGGADDDAIFGIIADCARGKDGQTYVLDQQLGLVHALDQRGNTTCIFGGVGEGPGEFESPRGLAVLEDGRVVVLQPSPARMSLFDAKGVYRGELRVPGRPDSPTMVLGLAVVDSGVILHEISTVQADAGMAQRQTITAYGLYGDGPVRQLCGADRNFDNARVVIREADMTPFQWSTASDRICISRGWQFDISIFGFDGIKICDLVNVDVAQRRSSGQRAAVESYIRRGGGAAGAEVEVEKFDRDIQWLGVTDEKAIWVLTSQGARAARAGVLGNFQVYGLDGNMISEIELVAVGRPSRDKLIVGRDCLYVLTNYASAFSSWRLGRSVGAADGGPGADKDSDLDAEQMGVICYRLPRLAELPARLDR